VAFANAIVHAFRSAAMSGRCRRARDHLKQRLQQRRTEMLVDLRGALSGGSAAILSGPT
jgi:hypothetical protein